MTSKNQLLKLKSSSDLFPNAPRNSPRNSFRKVHSARNLDDNNSISIQRKSSNVSVGSETSVRSALKKSTSRINLKKRVSFSNPISVTDEPTRDYSTEEEKAFEGSTKTKYSIYEQKKNNGACLMICNVS